jgi:iron complex outermembrane recepter protein
MNIGGFDRVTGAKTTKFDDSATSPVVGIVVKPIEQVALYANRIEGLAQGPTAPATAVNSGQVFAPFKSVQYEVGAKLDLGKFGASLALFQTKQPSGFTDPDTLVFDVSGEQRNRGIELLMFGEPLAGVRLLGGVTLIEAILESTAGGQFDGNDAVGVPRYQANFGAEWDPWFLPKVTLSARVLHTAPQYLNQANTQEIPSWSRLDIGSRYTTEIDNRIVVFRANIENVTNEAYWASTHGGYLTQGVPLTAKLSVSVDF